MAKRRPARRRTSAARRNTTEDVGVVLWLAGAVAVIVVISLIVRFFELHPITGSLIVAALAGLAVWLFIRRMQENERQRRIAEQRRAWEEQERARLAAIQAVRAREIATYHQMNAREFEHALAYLCERDGCTSVQVVGKAGDLGADVIATAPDGRRIVIQAKRYAPTTVVSGPDLQKFGGTCYAVHRAGVAAVVTTSGFTKQARQYADHMRIRLWDNDALAGWASRTGPAPWH